MKERQPVAVAMGFEWRKSAQAQAPSWMRGEIPSPQQNNPRFCVGYFVAGMLDIFLFYAIIKNIKKQIFSAVYKKLGKWYLGWIEEIPGVNTQGRTLKEVKENLKDALLLILEVNRASLDKEIAGNVIREPLAVTCK